MIYPENTLLVREPTTEEATTGSLVGERTNMRNVFHLFQVFFAPRHSSNDERTRRNVNKGGKRKCSEIKFKHPHQLPFDLRDMDVGMSIA